MGLWAPRGIPNFGTKFLDFSRTTRQNFVLKRLEGSGGPNLSRFWTYQVSLQGFYISLIFYFWVLKSIFWQVFWVFNPVVHRGTLFPERPTYLIPYAYRLVRDCAKHSLQQTIVCQHGGGLATRALLSCTQTTHRWGICWQVIVYFKSINIS